MAVGLCTVASEGGEEEWEAGEEKMGGGLAALKTEPMATVSVELWRWCSQPTPNG